MALPLQDSASAELRKDASKAGELARHEREGSEQQQADDVAVATPPPTQQMDRQASDDDDSGAADPGRIPAAVFERNPSGSNKDWSMMSTESVFALQVAPSGDFTGFFLAHPELMDISTPPRASTADADVLKPHFDSIPELPEASINGSYSFAFPNLIEDRRHSSKKVQDEQPPASAATMEAAPAPAPAPAQTTSKPEAAPEKEEAKGGLFSCFPCCS